nr:uncharacterized protein [Tanacetum cinerariifolium]
MMLPRFHDTPPPLDNLLSHDQPSTAEFRDNIRVYNSMFSFTSFGAKIDNSINTGRAPYTFRINRQNYHWMGSLLPAEGMPPKFAQLYFFDTQNEYNASIVSEVAAIIINDFEDAHPTRDIIVDRKDTGLQLEEQRLKWTRNSQDTLRVDLYHNLCDAVPRGDTSAVGLGKRIVLPRTFTGSPSCICDRISKAGPVSRPYPTMVER